MKRTQPEDLSAAVSSSSSSSSVSPGYHYIPYSYEAELYFACYYGDEGKVTQLLNKGVKSQIVYGNKTPLEVAINLKHEGVIRALLKDCQNPADEIYKASNPGNYGFTQIPYDLHIDFYYACEHYDHNILNFLLQRPDFNPNTFYGDKSLFFQLLSWENEEDEYSKREYPVKFLKKGASTFYGRYGDAIPLFMALIVDQKHPGAGVLFSSFYAFLIDQISDVVRGLNPNQRMQLSSMFAKEYPQYTQQEMLTKLQKDSALTIYELVHLSSSHRTSKDDSSTYIYALTDITKILHYWKSKLPKEHPLQQCNINVKNAFTTNAFMVNEQSK